MAEVLIYSASLGFQYTCRSHEGVNIYDSPRFFRSRFEAKKEIRRRFPTAKVVFT